MTNQMGTKLLCHQCSAEVVVTRGGSGIVNCCDVAMDVVAGTRGDGVADRQAASSADAGDQDDVFFS